ncbi:unnamed protein product [Rhodiola kirilowii]
MFPRRPAALKAHSTFVAYKNLIIHPPIFSSLPFPAHHVINQQLSLQKRSAFGCFLIWGLD